MIQGARQWWATYATLQLTMADEKPLILDNRSRGKNLSETESRSAKGSAMFFGGAFVGLILAILIGPVPSAHSFSYLTTASTTLAVVAFVFRKTRMLGIGMLLAAGVFWLTTGMCNSFFSAI